jgi:hypothetical protein
MNVIQLKQHIKVWLSVFTQPIWKLRLLPLEKLYSYDTKDIFKGKRVAIIGAADSALNTGLGEFIEGFDVIVRVNRGPFLIADEQWKKDIGSRTDVLFSYDNLAKYDAAVGDKIFKLMVEQKVKHLIIVKLWHKADGGYIYQFLKNFYKKLSKDLKIYFYNKEQRKKILKLYNGNIPTTGLAAIYAILQSEAKECYITGFTFFKTEYMAGYRDNAKSKEHVLKYINEAGLHNIDVEWKLFKEMYNSGNYNIVLDKFLQAVITQD